MRRFPVFAVISSILAGGCSSVPPHRPQFSGTFPIEDCPDDLQGRVTLVAQAFELPSPSPRSEAVSTVGILGRRLRVSTATAALDPADRITWSSLSISTLGGTFDSWTRLETDHVTLDPIGDSSPAGLKGDTRRSELATVDLSPGQLKIMRFAYDKTDLAGTIAIDVQARPGGVIVDNTVVHLPKLWEKPGVAVSPEKVQVDVSSTRHPPGLDTVEAVAELKYVIHRARTGDEWSCSAETRLTVVDQDAIRLPLWDLGLAPRNSGRESWLGLFTPSLGLVRVIFESAAEANALANWLQATSATRLGKYTLGVFEQPKRPLGPSFRPVDADALQTFRPLTAADIAAIRVGPVGEV